ncbi:MAG: hypothetical protein MJZ12_05130 [Prevotella sp.]|nr:hypothetical protein [Prevotella sp.]
MTREEAIARGWEVWATKHSMKRRTPWHDYSRKGTYMLTLVTRDRLPLFGRLVGSLDAEATEDRPHVELSALGKAIKEKEIWKIHRFYPMIDVWKLCVMPDHLHLIVRVNEDMGEGKHLGLALRGFKAGCSKAWWKITGEAMPDVEASGTRSANRNGEGGSAQNGEGGSGRNGEGGSGRSGEVGSGRNGEGGSGRSGVGGYVTVTEASSSVQAAPLPLFEAGYNDKTLMREGQLDNWKRYLDDNPRRLMMKRYNPQLFTVLSGMDIVGEKCQVVGNRFLLDIPDKMAVIVHRRYTDEDNARLKEEWLDCGERGGVLVSAAIAPKEKEVLREAMERGYRIILLRENGFPPLYKPSGEAFDACAEGILLQISPWEFHMERKTISREQCLYLNAMAERIVNNV